MGTMIKRHVSKIVNIVGPVASQQKDSAWRRKLVMAKRRVGASLRWFDHLAAEVFLGELVRKVGPHQPPQKKYEFENIRARFLN